MLMRKKRSIVLVSVFVVVYLVATNSTVGKLYRGISGCARTNLARLNDHSFELGQSLHTLQVGPFHPGTVKYEIHRNQKIKQEPYVILKQY